MKKDLSLSLKMNIAIFFLVFLVHLLRVLTGFYAQLGEWIVPIWFNFIFIFIALFMIYLNYKHL